MATWLHYTDRKPFILVEHVDANAPGGQPGLFVYDEEQKGWPGRRCIEIDAPVGAVVLVQSFDDDEIPGEKGFSEWFIPAAAFPRCRIITPKEG